MVSLKFTDWLEPGERLYVTENRHGVWSVAIIDPFGYLRNRRLCTDAETADMKAMEELANGQ